MKTPAARLLAVCWMALAANSAHACCLWPFCGWGLGYGPAYPMSTPAWGTYSASYAPWYPGPAYSAWNNCCPTTCCDPCNNCSSGACGTPSQQSGSGTSGSLKPRTDPAFQERRNTPTNDDAPASGRTLPPVENLSQPADDAQTDTPADNFAPRTRRQPATPADSFDSLNEPTTPAPFDSNDSISNKPPISDPDDSSTTNPIDENTPPADNFGPPSTNDQPTPTGPQTRRFPTPTTSRLAEVATPKRLASTLRKPSTNTPDTTAPTPTATRDRLRWISNPAPDTHVRL